MIPGSKEGWLWIPIISSPHPAVLFPSSQAEPASLVHVDDVSCTTLPRPINGESCMRFDAKTDDGRGAVRSTGVSSCGGMGNGLEEGATSSGAIPLRYGDVEYAGGPRICHLGVVKTVPTLAPTRTCRATASTQGRTARYHPGIYVLRLPASCIRAHALSSRCCSGGVCGPFRDPKDDRVCGSPAAAAGRVGLRSRWTRTVGLEPPVSTCWRLLQSFEKEWVAPPAKGWLVFNRCESLALISATSM